LVADTEETFLTPQTPFGMTNSLLVSVEPGKKGNATAAIVKEMLRRGGEELNECYPVDMLQHRIGLCNHYAVSPGFAPPANSAMTWAGKCGKLSIYI
jgi:hypothetical protein